MLINKKIMSTWDFISEVFAKFIDDKAPKFGASLSFYTIFSLAPILLILIALTGLLFGNDVARGVILTQIRDVIGSDGARIIRTALRKSTYSYENTLTIIFSLVTILIGSTVVFADLQESLNLIWKVKPAPGRGIIKGFILDRSVSFLMILLSGFILLLSLLASAAIQAFKDFFNEQFFTIPISLIEAGNMVISFLIIFFLFVLIFKFLPNVLIEWKHVWVGALFTTILFALGKYLIGIYLTTSSMKSSYGAAGSLVVFLIWIYYSTQIFFLGAEFTQVYAEKFGDGIKPRPGFIKFFDDSNPIES